MVFSYKISVLSYSFRLSVVFPRCLFCLVLSCSPLSLSPQNKYKNFSGYVCMSLSKINLMYSIYLSIDLDLSNICICVSLFLYLPHRPCPLHRYNPSLSAPVLLYRPANPSLDPDMYHHLSSDLSGTPAR